MYNHFSEKVLNNSEVIINMWVDEIEFLKEKGETVRISERVFEATNREFVSVIFSSIENEGCLINLEEFADKLINLGWPLGYITDGLQGFRRVAISFILSESDNINTDYITSLLESADAWIEPIIYKLVNEYTVRWEDVVSLQRITLKELSAPLIPIMENITVMPLIGTIDTERARSIMENLLKGVIDHDSEVVLIDITGVPIVDTMVAHHIIEAAEAVRLIGATCILVGIRPEIAQTIVSLGIDLSEFITKSSLRKGVITALEITNRTIIKLDNKDGSIDEIIESLRKA